MHSWLQCVLKMQLELVNWHKLDLIWDEMVFHEFAALTWNDHWPEFELHFGTLRQLLVEQILAQEVAFHLSCNFTQFIELIKSHTGVLMSADKIVLASWLWRTCSFLRSPREELNIHQRLNSACAINDLIV